MGRRTVRSSSRQRAARADQSDMVIAGRRGIAKDSTIDIDSDSEIMGVQMSERARRGESHPALPESRTKHTASKEPKSVPKTGVAKSRKRS